MYVLNDGVCIRYVVCAFMCIRYVLAESDLTLIRGYEDRSKKNVLRICRG